MTGRVMLVDDEPFIREAIQIFFRSRGMEIVIAANAEECLDHLERGFRGIILMDIMMPRLDGWDTIREIVQRGLFPGNIIIMLTAKDEPDEKMNGLQEYVADYVAKPCAPQELLDTVSYYLGLLEPGVALV
ncbi:response regulator [Geotalea uraniireducens]|uniref:Response regulator n=1 Tax=Geotalea uraniireducens TaxID=351604 RepID=A0ABM8EQS3_9BACT|nr:response regulator [Geotalea uraniireducens]BDV44918.1 response regulator [Geotalea uraniireducens]